MIIEQAIQNALLDSSSIKSYTGDRVYYPVALQDTGKPYVVIQKITGFRDKTNTAALAWANPLMQIDVYGTSYTQCNAIAALIQDILQSYSGVLGTKDDVTGVTIGACFYDNEFYSYEQDTGLHRLTLEFSVAHKEA